MFRHLFLMALALASVPSARAVTLYVAVDGNDGNPGTHAAPFNTIARGLSFARTGDTVMVGDGVYTGAGNTALDFGGRDIVLASAGGAAACTIDAGGAARLFTFNGGETAACTVRGFTLAGGSDPAGGGAVIIGNARPTFVGCTIAGAAAGGSADGLGGGVAVIGASAAPSFQACVFTGCTVTGNTGAASGGAVALSGGASAVFSDCTFDGNRANTVSGTANGGGVAVLPASSATFSRCAFTNNIVHSERGYANGGALNVNGGRMTLTDCTIDHCGVGTYLDVGQMSKSASGGGIYIAGASATASLVNCRLTANWMSAESQDVDGGGMYVGGAARVGLTNCIVSNNEVTGEARCSGAGIAVFDAGTTLTLLNTDIVDNRSYNGSYGHGVGGGVATWNGGSTRITNGIFSGNDNTLKGPNLLTDPSSTCAATYSLFADAVPGEGNITGTPAYVPNTYRLAAGSPGINAGSAAAAGLPAFDIAYNERAAGSAPDMGAYEFGAPPLVARNLYVDGAAGNDQNPGTPSSPIATVNSAVGRISGPDLWAIHIRPGRYHTGPLRIASPSRLESWQGDGPAVLGAP